MSVQLITKSPGLLDDWECFGSADVAGDGASTAADGCEVKALPEPYTGTSVD